MLVFIFFIPRNLQFDVSFQSIPCRSIPLLMSSFPHSESYVYHTCSLNHIFGLELLWGESYIRWPRGFRSISNSSFRTMSRMTFRTIAWVLTLLWSKMFEQSSQVNKHSWLKCALLAQALRMLRTFCLGGFCPHGSDLAWLNSEAGTSTFPIPFFRFFRIKLMISFNTRLWWHYQFLWRTVYQNYRVRKFDSITLSLFDFFFGFCFIPRSRDCCPNVMVGAFCILTSCSSSHLITIEVLQSCLLNVNWKEKISSPLYRFIFRRSKRWKNIGVLPFACNFL